MVRKRHAYPLPRVISVVLLAIGFSAICGHATGRVGLYKWDATDGMSLNSAIGFIFVAIAIYAMSVRK